MKPAKISVYVLYIYIYVCVCVCVCVFIYIVYKYKVYFKYEIGSYHGLIGERFSLSNKTSYFFHVDKEITITMVFKC